MVSTIDLGTYSGQSSVNLKLNTTKFGSSAGYFNGNAYATIPSSNDFAFSGDFTVECWSYPTVVSNVTNIIDASSYLNSVTNTNVTINKNIVKYGSGSAFFDGSTSYLSVPAGTPFAPGTGDFTVECWVYCTSFSNSPIIWNQLQNGWNYFVWQITTGGILAFTYGTSGGGTALTTSSSVPLNQWVHVALVRRSNIVHQYINGVDGGGSATVSQSFNNTSMAPIIGKYWNSTYYFTGLIDELRYSNGIARYTGNFTPPTSSFVSDSNTSCLLHFDINSAQSWSVFDSRSSVNSSSGFLWYILNGALNVSVGGTDIISVSNAVSINSWYHLALSRVSGQLYLFVNGSLLGQVSNNVSFSDGYFTLGSSVNAPANLYSGYFDEFRVTNGIGRYISSFSVPTAPFDNTDSHWSYVKALLHFENETGVISRRWEGKIDDFRITKVARYSSAFNTYLPGPMSDVQTPTPPAVYTPVQYPNNGFRIYKSGVDSSYVLNLASYDSVNLAAGPSYSLSTPSSGDHNWHHWTWVVDKMYSQIKVFMDGILVNNVNTFNTSVPSIPFSGTKLYIGNDRLEDSAWTGEIDQVRIYGDTITDADVKALYGETVSSIDVFKNEHPLLDSYYGNVVSLIEFENGITDQVGHGVNNHGVTLSGVSKFGSSSGSFNGSSYFTLSPASDFLFGSGDFTVECWVYLTSMPSSDLLSSLTNLFTVIGCNQASSTSGWSFIIGQTVIMFIDNGVVKVSGYHRISPSNWYHIAVYRSGSNIYLSVNGIVVGNSSISGSLSVPSSPVAMIGADVDGGSNFIGYIDELRVTKNIVRYATTSPVISGTYDSAWALNPLLIRGEGVNNSVIITDDFSHNIVRYGNPVISTAQSKYGNSSVYFDGNSYIYVNGSSDFIFGSNDFTAECWVYLVSYPSKNVSVMSSNANIASEYNGFNLDIFPDGSLRGYLGNNSSWVQTATTRGGLVTLRTWTHLAFVRSSATMTIYVNGVACANNTAGGVTALNPTNNLLGIGGRMMSSGGSNVSEIQFSGSSGSTSFPDDVSGVTWQANGSVKVQNVQFKFGTGGMGGSGANSTLSGGDYLKNTTIKSLGVADWTIRCWVCPTTVSTNICSIFYMGAGYGVGLFIHSNNKFTYYLSSNGSSNDIASATSGTTVVTANTWYFVELCYDSAASTYRLYVNGIQEATTVSTTKVFSNFSANYIGTNNASSTYQFYGYIDKVEIKKLCDHPNGNTYAVPASAPSSAIDALGLTGYVDEVRVTNNLARYGNNFIPEPKVFVGMPTLSQTFIPSVSAFLPVVPNTTSSVSYDSEWNYVTCLLHGNGTVGSHTFTDEHGHSFSYTNAVISSTQSKFGGSSIYFNGSSSINGSIANEWLIPGDFTVESWIYTSSSSTFVIYDQRTTGYAAGIWLGCVNGSLAFQQNQTVAITAPAPFPLNTWNHVALTRLGNVITLYQNGISQGTYTSSMNYTDGNFVLGKAFDITTNDFTGYMNDFRITNGYCRYVANFIVPAQFTTYNTNAVYPLPAPYDNPSITESSTPPSLDDQVYKFGTSSVKFTSGGQYLKFDPSSSWDLGSTFTIEMWVRPNTDSFGVIMSTRSYYKDGYELVWNGSRFGFVRDVGFGNTNLHMCLGTYVKNVWHHLTVTGDSSNVYLFVDGNLEVTLSNTVPWLANGSPLYLGTTPQTSNNTSVQYYGNIDGLRITSGVCRYSSAFSVPSSEFAISGDQYSSHVQLLINFNVQRTVYTWTDPTTYGNSSNTYTQLGNVQLDNTTYKWGGGAVRFNGTDSALTLSQHNQVKITNPGTIEFWVRLNSSGRIHSLLNVWNGIDGVNERVAWRLFVNANNNIQFDYSINGSESKIASASGSTPINVGSWYFITMLVDYNILRIYVNGNVDIKLGNVSIYNNTSDPLWIGAQSSTDGFATTIRVLDGWIDDLRFTENYARKQMNVGLRRGIHDRYDYVQDGLGTGLAVIDSTNIAFGKPTLNTFDSVGPNYFYEIGTKNLYMHPDQYITGSGGVEVMRRQDVTWVTTNKLVQPGLYAARETNEHFGDTIKVKDNLIAISAPNSSSDAGFRNRLTNAGAIYLYEITSSNALKFDQKITSTQRSVSANFGNSFDFKGTEMVVQSPGHTSIRNIVSGWVEQWHSSITYQIAETHSHIIEYFDIPSNTLLPELKSEYSPNANWNNISQSIWNPPDQADGTSPVNIKNWDTKATADNIRDLTDRNGYAGANAPGSSASLYQLICLRANGSEAGYILSNTTASNGLAGQLAVPTCGLIYAMRWPNTSTLDFYAITPCPQGGQDSTVLMANSLLGSAVATDGVTIFSGAPGMVYDLNGANGSTNAGLMMSWYYDYVYTQTYHVLQGFMSQHRAANCYYGSQLKYKNGVLLVTDNQASGATNYLEIFGYNPTSHVTKYNTAVSSKRTDTTTLGKYQFKRSGIVSASEIISGAPNEGHVLTDSGRAYLWKNSQNYPTSYLMHFENTIVDTSLNSNNISNHGLSCVASPTFPVMFGSYSALFAGSQYFTGTIANQLTSDFTVELFYYPPSGVYNSTNVIIDTRTSSATTSTGFALIIDGSGYLRLYTAGGDQIYNKTTALTLNAWNHIALVKSANIITLYINGSSVGTYTTSAIFSDSVFTFGSQSTAIYSAGSYLQGYVDEFRISTSAIYSGTSFTVPVAAFSASGESLINSNTWLSDDLPGYGNGLGFYPSGFFRGRFASNQFGYSVALQAHMLCVGSPNHQYGSDGEAYSANGATFVYKWDSTDQWWKPSQKWHGPNNAGESKARMGELIRWDDTYSYLMTFSRTTGLHLYAPQTTLTPSISADLTSYGDQTNLINTGTDYTLYWEVTNGIPLSVYYVYATSYQVTSINLVAPAANSDRMPTNFSIYYSVDSTTWSLMQNFIDNTAWSTGESRTYNITTPMNYPRYKITINSIGQSALDLKVARMRLNGSVLSGQSISINTASLADLTGTSIPNQPACSAISFGNTNLSLIQGNINQGAFYAPYMPNVGCYNVSTRSGSTWSAFGSVIWTPKYTDSRLEYGYFPALDLSSVGGTINSDVHLFGYGTVLSSDNNNLIIAASNRLNMSNTGNRGSVDWYVWDSNDQKYIYNTRYYETNSDTSSYVRLGRYLTLRGNTLVQISFQDIGGTIGYSKWCAYWLTGNWINNSSISLINESGPINAGIGTISGIDFYNDNTLIAGYPGGDAINYYTEGGTWKRFIRSAVNSSTAFTNDSGTGSGYDYRVLVGGIEHGRAASDKFGTAVNVVGNWAYITAPNNAYTTNNNDVNEKTNPGVIYEYYYDGTMWKYKYKIFNGNQLTNNQGYAIDLKNDMMLVTNNTSASLNGGYSLYRRYSLSQHTQNNTKTLFGNNTLALQSPFLNSIFQGLVIPNKNNDFEMTSDYTIEFWYYPTSTPASSAYIMWLGQNSSPYYLDYSANQGKSGSGNHWLFYHGNDGYLHYCAGQNDYSTCSLTLNAWNHIVIMHTVSNGYCAIFKNGVYVNQWNQTNLIAYLGGDNLYINGMPNTYMSDIRFTKGVARYTAGVNFSPPTSLYSDGSDPYISNVVMHLPLNGTGTNIVDSTGLKTVYNKLYVDHAWNLETYEQNVATWYAYNPAIVSDTCYLVSNQANSGRSSGIYQNNYLANSGQVSINYSLNGTFGNWNNAANNWTMNYDSLWTIFAGSYDESQSNNTNCEYYGYTRLGAAKLGGSVAISSNWLVSGLPGLARSSLGQSLTGTYGGLIMYKWNSLTNKYEFYVWGNGGFQSQSAFSVIDLTDNYMADYQGPGISGDPAMVYLMKRITNQVGQNKWVWETVSRANDRNTDEGSSLILTDNFIAYGSPTSNTVPAITGCGAFFTLNKDTTTGTEMWTSSNLYRGSIGDNNGTYVGGGGGGGYRGGGSRTWPFNYGNYYTGGLGGDNLVPSGATLFKHSSPHLAPNHSDANRNSCGDGGTYWNVAGNGRVVLTYIDPVNGTTVVPYDFIAYDPTGAVLQDQIWVVPTGVTSATFLLWGAGGGSGSDWMSRGGAGACISYTMSVSPGDLYTIMVGERGQHFNENLNGNFGYSYYGFGGGSGVKDQATNHGGGGGGMSAVFHGTVASGTPIVIAAGGGGGASIQGAGTQGGWRDYAINSGSAGIDLLPSAEDETYLSDVSINNRFAGVHMGTSVGLMADGQTAIITQPYKSYGKDGRTISSNAGGALVYKRDLTGTWNMVQAIEPSITNVANQYFGLSRLKIKGTVALFAVPYTAIDYVTPHNYNDQTLSSSSAIEVFNSYSYGWKSIQRITAQSLDAAFYDSFSLISSTEFVTGHPFMDSPTGYPTLTNAGGMTTYDYYNGSWQVSKIIPDAARDSNTVSLFKFDGASATTLTDDKALTFVPYGSVVPSTTQYKMGSQSYYFNNGYLICTNPGNSTKFSGNFAVDFWVYNTVSGSGMMLFDTRSTSNSTAGFTVYLKQTTNAIALYCNGDAIVGPVLSANTWYHIAVMRNIDVYNSTVYLYVNGNMSGFWNTGASGNNFSDGNLILGNDYPTKTAPFIGYIDEFRISNIERLVTFTPPTTTLTSITNTTSLMTFDTNLGDSVGSVNNPVNVTRSTSVYKYGSGSAYFNGSNAYITKSSPGNAAQFTGDFTIEFWFNASAITNNIYLFTTTGPGSGSVPAFTMYFSGGSIYINAKNTGMYTSAISAGVWYHFAVVKQSGIISVFLNGILQGSGNDGTVNYNSSGFYIGSSWNGNYFNGYIDDFRIVNGTAIYSNSFTPPTSPYTADANTTSLMHFEGSLPSLSDSSEGLVLSVYGTASLSTTHETGTKSLSFGSNGYVRCLSPGYVTQFSGDFTLDFWINPSNTGCMFDCGVGALGGTSGFQVTNANNKLNLNIGGSTVASGGTVSLNVWQHIAVVSYSSNITLYINGISVASYSTNMSFNDGSYWIGKANDAAGTVTLQGFIDDIRISGSARWLANFNTVVLAEPGNAYGRFAGDNFGQSAAIGSVNTGTGWLVIGAPNHAYGVNGSSTAIGRGAIYSYNLNLNNQWSYENKLVNDADGSNLNLGMRTYVRGNRVLTVGITGVIKTIDRNSSGIWAMNPTTGASISGQGVAFYNQNTLVIGMSSSSTGNGLQPTISGAGGVESYTINSNYSLTGSQYLNVPGRSNGRNANDLFGASVIIGDGLAYLAIGAPNHNYTDIGNARVSGSGTIFTYNLQSNSWHHEVKVQSIQNIANSTGNSLLSSGNMVITNNSAYSSNSGYMEMFKRTSPGNWLSTMTITDSNGYLNGNNTGAMSLVSDRLVFGRPLSNGATSGVTLSQVGDVVTYTKIADSWSNTGNILTSFGSTNARVDIGDHFGYCITSNANTLVVGVPSHGYDSIGTNKVVNAGAVWVFNKTPNGYVMTNKITAPSTYRTTNAKFGSAVSIDDANGYILVGAPGDGTTGGSGSNRAFLYSIGGNNIVSYVTTLVPDSFSVSDLFGESVAVNGNRIVIGSPYNDYDQNNTDMVTDAGAAYIYLILDNGTVEFNRKEVAFTNDTSNPPQDIGLNPRMPSDTFGYAVALNDNKTMVIGGPLSSYDNLGQNYLLDSGSAWLRYTDTTPPAAMPATTMIRTVSNAFNGFSLKLLANEGTNWSSSALATAISSMYPGEICMPGSQDASYWNWSLGGIESDSSRLTGITLPYTTAQKAVTDLTPANIHYLTGALGIPTTFMMNIITSDVNQQLAEMDALVAAGYTINKIILGGEEYNDISNFDNKITPSSYISLIKSWVPTIRNYSSHKYQNVKIAAIGYLDYQAAIDNGLSRATSWNYLLQQQIPASQTINHWVDAIAFEYFDLVHPKPGINPGTNYAASIALNQWNDASAVITSSLLTNFTTNEWWIVNHDIYENARDIRVAGTWLHGMINLGRSMIFMNAPKVTTAYCSDLMGTPTQQAMVSPAYSKMYKYTSVTRSLVSATGDTILGLGQAMSILGKVLSTGSIVNAGPVATGNSQVLAWEFQSADSTTKKMLIINAQDNNYQIVVSGTAETWTASPWTVITNPSTQITHVSNITLRSRGLIVPGWSIAVINRT